MNCPPCHSDNNMRKWGGPANHSIKSVAGIRLKSALLPFFLYKCHDCGFILKNPQIQSNELRECYRVSSDRVDLSSATPVSPRSLWIKLENLAKKYSPGRRILDVGCSNGAMLSTWDRSWAKYGVEPSAMASRCADKRGINVLAETIEQVYASSKFDCIISVDVIEHISRPLEWMASVVEHLSARGVVIIATGNMEYHLARIARSNYWYASFAEHVSFFSRRSLSHLASAVGGEVVDSLEYSFGGDLSPMISSYVQACKFMLAVTPKAISSAFAPWSALSLRNYPVLTSLPDHLAVVIANSPERSWG